MLVNKGAWSPHHSRLLAPICSWSTPNLKLMFSFEWYTNKKNKTKKVKQSYFVCMFRCKHFCLLSPFPKRRRLFWLFFCRYDYLKITNEHNQTFGKYCGVKTGRNVYVTGRFAVISFHSDGSRAFSGYLLNFSYISGYIF